MSSLFFWLLSLSIIILRIIHVVVSIVYSFLLLRIISIAWIYPICFSIQVPVQRHLGCFQLWAITVKVAMIICVHILCGHMLSFLLAKYLGGEWLGLMVGVYLTF